MCVVIHCPSQDSPATPGDVGASPTIHTAAAPAACWARHRVHQHCVLLTYISDSVRRFKFEFDSMIISESLTGCEYWLKFGVCMFMYQI